jgi:fermentation-respiration switch protein FrsA (DUF1100 family)
LDAHQVWPFVRTVIITGAVIYVLIVIILWLFQSRLVYFPRTEIESTPDKAGLEFESIEFQAADGVTLAGWYVPSDDSDDVLLFCHGNAGNISHRMESIRVFHRLGLSVFIFDYRGYGQSEGRPGEEGTYLDAAAAWDYLVGERSVDPGRIIIFGRSLGGAVAAWLAKERSPRGLILESSFTSIPDMGAETYPFFPVRLLSRFGYNTREYVGEARCPVLIVHSRDDDLVPFHHGREIFEAANEPREFLEIEGSHNDGFLVSGEKYQEGLGRFISGSDPG